MRVAVTVTNKNPDTIFNRLAAELGREPTDSEVKARVLGILRSSKSERPKPPEFNEYRPFDGTYYDDY